jgi:hypothetical protein
VRCPGQWRQLANKGHEVSLERRKIYVATVDPQADKLAMLRVSDESGSDYPYSKESFVAATLPQPIRRALLEAVSRTFHHPVFRRIFLGPFLLVRIMYIMLNTSIEAK